MSMLSSVVPLSSGPRASPREGSRLRIGRRLRKWTGNKEESQEPAVALEVAPPLQGTKRQFGPTFQKAQARVSRLWNRHDPVNFTATNTVSSSPIPSDDECCCSSSKSNPQTIKKDQLQLPSSKHSMRKRLMKPFLHGIRTRRSPQPYSALAGVATADKEIDHGHDPALTTKPTTASMVPSANKMAPSFSHPTLLADGNEIMHAERTACGVKPPLDDSCEDQQQTRDEPAPQRNRKHRKPRHGDDSVLIGMMITFDPTSELLDMGTTPVCIKRTFLSELQKNAKYQGFLLGNMTYEEESSSTDDTPSVSDILGFHLDCFALPKEVDTSVEELVLEECPFPRDSSFEMLDKEVEIVFSSPPKIPDPDFSNPVENSFETQEEEREEEIEIVFYPMEHVHSPPGIYDDDSSAKSSKYMDCQSNASDCSPLPVEWMLPQAVWQLPVQMVDESFELNGGDEAPEYEWFLPEHLDVAPYKQHTPLALFGDGEHQKAKISATTPSTMGETCTFSFANQTSFDHGAEDDIASAEVLSIGSLASDAVQSLLELCRRSDAAAFEKGFSSRDNLFQRSLA